MKEINHSLTIKKLLLHINLAFSFPLVETTFVNVSYFSPII